MTEQTIKWLAAAGIACIFLLFWLVIYLGKRNQRKTNQKLFDEYRYDQPSDAPIKENPIKLEWWEDATFHKN